MTYPYGILDICRDSVECTPLAVAGISDFTACVCKAFQMASKRWPNDMSDWRFIWIWIHTPVIIGSIWQSTPAHYQNIIMCEICVPQGYIFDPKKVKANPKDHPVMVTMGTVCELSHHIAGKLWLNAWTSTNNYEMNRSTTNEGILHSPAFSFVSNCLLSSLEFHDCF